MNSAIMGGYVDLRRNFATLPFEPTMLDSQKNDSLSIVAKALEEREDRWTLLKMRELNRSQVLGLKEKRVVDEALVGKPDASLFLRQDEKAWIYMNMEDHVLVRSLSEGFEAGDAIRQAKDIAQAIGDQVPFAKDERIGWLTARPLYAGTGLQISFVLHLPMLSMMQQIKPLAAAMEAEHLFSLRPLSQGDDKNPSALFVLSNLFGAYDGSEKLCAAVRQAAEKLIDKELKLRERILKKAARSTYVDQVFRAYGILKYARRLTENEFLGFWSKLRLGAAVGLLPIDMDSVDQLLQSTRRSRLIEIMESPGDEHAIHFTRADVVRAALDGGQ